MNKGAFLHSAKQNRAFIWGRWETLVSRSIPGSVENIQNKPPSCSFSEPVCRLMYTGGVTELYFQMYNVSVRCKEGRLLASCHLAHCTVIFFPHINTIAIFCMYFHRYNLTLSSTAWGIKRENILLSNSCPWFPSSTTLVILSEIRLIFLQKHIQKCIQWSGNNFCFMIFFVMSLQLCNLPSLTIYSFQKTGFYYKTWAERSSYCIFSILVLKP